MPPPRHGDGAAGGHVDGVKAKRGELGGQSDGVVHVPAAVDVIGGADAHGHGHLLSHRLTDGAEDLAQQPGTTGQVTAVCIGARVHKRCEELVQ